jgi:hypothetical protein
MPVPKRHLNGSASIDLIHAQFLPLALPPSLSFKTGNGATQEDRRKGDSQ